MSACAGLGKNIPSTIKPLADSSKTSAQKNPSTSPPGFEGNGERRRELIGPAASRLPWKRRGNRRPPSAPPELGSENNGASCLVSRQIDLPVSWALVKTDVAHQSLTLGGGRRIHSCPLPALPLRLCLDLSRSQQTANLFNYPETKASRSSLLTPAAKCWINFSRGKAPVVRCRFGFLHFICFEGNTPALVRKEKKPSTEI